MAERRVLKGYPNLVWCLSVCISFGFLSPPFGLAVNASDTGKKALTKKRRYL